MDNQENGKWIKTRVTSKDCKVLMKLAIDEEVSLAELLRRSLKLLLKERR